MASFEDEELLTEYVQWAAKKKITGLDVTPATFIVERAQEAAYNRVVEALAFIKATNFGDQNHKVDKVRKILEG